MSNEELVQLIQNGDGDAVLLLWVQVEKFITMQAKKFLSCRVGFYELDDLIQSGFLAMMKAAKEYNPEKETVFLTWLDWCLKYEFPRSAGIMKQRNITKEDGKQAKIISDPLKNALSLDCPLSADDPDGDTLGDMQPDPRDPYEEAERRIYLEQLRQQLKKALATLPEDQRAAILHRYRDCMTIEQTGAAMQRTKAEAKKLERAALDTLRKGKTRLELEQFIDDRTPFYGKVGIRQFMTDGESIVERCVFKRDAIRREREKS